MRHLKKFTSLQEYNLNKDSVSVPNIVYVKEGTSVDNVVYEKPDYYRYQYLTTTALTNGTISFTMFAALTTSYCKSVSYSLDEGQTWTLTNNVADTEVVVNVNVTAGQRVLWKANASRFETTTTMSACNPKFSSTCQFVVSGNIKSLTHSDFVNATSWSTACTFSGLFKNCVNLIDARNLYFNSTSTSNYCYGGMFDGCTSLKFAPDMKKITHAANWSFGYMFRNCTSLETAPVLSTTTSTSSCYKYMFYGCSSLKYIKCMLIYTTASATSEHLTNWVSGVSSTGTFVKNGDPTNIWSTTGVSNIPAGWTVETATS